MGDCKIQSKRGQIESILTVSRLLCMLSGLVGVSMGNTDARAAGAITPFITVEAESGTLAGGAVVSAFSPGSTVPTLPTPQLEASGKAYVGLTNSGSSVSIVNPVANANAIVIRASIPDAASGGGITATLNLYVGGTFRQALTLSSKQSWNYYQSTTTPDDPNGGGHAYKFYNADRAFIIGTAIPAGTVVKLQKDSTNSAAYYNIDCVDFENVPAPLTQPANSLSITSSPYFADSTFTHDSTAVIEKCISDALSQGKTVWVPPGKFMLNSTNSGGLNLTGVTLNGAGVWYSTLYRNIPLPPPTTPWRSTINLGTNSTITDVLIDSTAIYRDIGGVSGDDYGLSSSGNNWLVQRVWIEHCDADWMGGQNSTFRDSRIQDGWADGINFNNGNAANPALLGFNLTATNNFIRNSGDDGLAIYSSAGTSGTLPLMHDCTMINNTVVSPWWANGVGLYGGTNMVIRGNLIADCGCNSGITIERFGSTGHPLQMGLVTGNTILRSGGWNGTDQHGIAVSSPSTTNTDVVIENNVFIDALRSGIRIGNYLDTVNISYNVFNHSAWASIWVKSGTTGGGTMNYNSVFNLPAGQTPYEDDATNTFTPSLLGNNWRGGVGAGVIFYQNISYGGSNGLPLTAGNYTAAQLAAMNVRSDWASSVTMPTNWTVIMYSGTNFTGTQWILTNNVPNFGTLTPSAIGQVASCKIAGLEDGTVYHFVCQKSAMSLDNNGSITAGTDLIQWPDSQNNSDQEWQMVDVGGGYWNLLCRKSDMDIDNGGSTTAGTAVTQFSIRTNNNQRWQFVPHAGGVYHLICETSGMALDNGGATTNGAVMTQYTDHPDGNANVTNQNWSLEFVR